MSRTLYGWLLRMHPPEFRLQFGDEMLWIFDEAREAEGAGGLLADATASVARPWLLRSGSWKILVALAGALLQVTAGGLGHLLFGPLARHGASAAPPPQTPIDLRALIRIIIWTVSGVGVMV